jgi:hypothetical protein
MLGQQEGGPVNSLTKCLCQPADRCTSGRNVGMHAQMMAQATSATDHMSVFGIVHVGSPPVVEARSVVSRIIEIAHVLRKGMLSKQLDIAKSTGNSQEA